MNKSTFLNSKSANFIDPKQQSKQSLKTKLTKSLNGIWQHLVKAIAHSNEPRIWQSQKHGQTIWHGYDPASGKSVTRFSETEMLIWLEERYYQQ